ncbi:ribbon-helix-helix domain-containing protein [Herbiconiux daphne]|uniref:Ribbon-helix-helix domain-containing protein n=1 Tax=Herbiconiux daphne TaxID=2970914 RepID=A0ABT2H589_9MICO|nr:ribbon-helix-helix domain-containing protein [Herbiconiux daphne]MCS5735063.1 ribbon-helix-helix domain-containing protein [Herbiconiux daphne]
MSDLISLPPSGLDAGSTIRPMSVRMTDDLRAQLDVLAQVNDRSVTEEVRLALERWVDQSKSDQQVQKRADAVRAEIERDAAVRRTAIESIFGSTPAVGGRPAPAARGSKKEGE